MLKEFRDFAVKGNAVDLAVGIIVGAAFGGVVKSLVDDIIMPPIGFVLGNVDFTNFYVVLKHGLKQPGPYDTLADAMKAGAITLRFGTFVNASVSFLITTFAVFLMVKAISKLRREKPVPVVEVKPVEPSEEVLLLREIRDSLKAAS